MSKISQITVEYGDNSDAINIRRLRYRQMMRLFGVLNKDAKPGDPPDPQNLAEFQVQLISATVCDADGKTLFTPDDVDSWSEETNGTAKINAYTKAINFAVDPGEATVAGN